MKEFKGTPGEFNVQFGDEVYATSGCDNHQVASCFDYNDARLFASSKHLVAALQHLVEVYDDPTGKQWTTTSKREALDKAREAINLALGE